MTNVGFIGLGAMGAPMAWNLDDAGFDLVVYNRTTDREQPFAEAGISVADSPKHLTKRCDVVCLMLSDGDAVAEALERDLGVLDGVDEETTVVQMSTIGYEETLAAAEMVTEAGGRFVDAPVSGTVGPAREGTLVGLAGGDEAVVGGVRPVLEAMCDPVVHCGDVGQGTNMKLFVNLLLGDAMSAFAEALVFGRQNGLSVSDMRTVIENGALDCPLFAGKGATIADGDFDSRFPVDYQFKDLSLALDRAGDIGVPLSQTAAAREAFSAARARGYGEEDMAAVIKPLEETADVSVRED
ncbi:NAD(P)-dependent oxidoreductase [Haloarcula nitratireducens]|uniref:NAD(P)-dependent oxidoreductase n=1 Tax=Haloarcula nitratireducens TaxID=2487749 RepID=A0AAW4P9K4_9EURY|nr:NAD(P)-dependent oxidoreductase [Halomicroarcula nitratireducens]MBX0294416.1 NAD(P)-dependent oxidoreductase [Halomicroarcula nitratireducens]